MKKFIFAVTLMVVSVAAFCQYDGFIDGVGLGYVDQTVKCFEQKGYEQVKSSEHPNSPLIFMLGFINKVDVLIMIQRKDEDSTDVRRIAIFYPPSKNASKDYSHHRKQFMKNFGKPSGQGKTSSYWSGLGTDDQDNLVYTIGIEDGHIYHSLENIDH
jgi:hypothetical protein